MSTDAVLVVQLAASAWLAGVIWLVQLIVYPTFREIGEGEWARFHARHTRRITPIVAPAMVVQLAASTWTFVARPAGVDHARSAVLLGAVGVTWLVTAWVSRSNHAALARGGSSALVASLVARNWIRTAAWTIALGAALALVLERS